VTVLKSTEWLGLTNVGGRTYEVVNWNKQEALTDRQGITRMFACYEEILKENNWAVTRQTSVLDFFRSSLGARESSFILLNVADDDGDDPPKEEVPPA
jgi:hypothetical protein